VEGASDSGSDQRWRAGRGVSPGPDEELFRGRDVRHDRRRLRLTHRIRGGRQSQHGLRPGRPGHQAVDRVAAGSHGAKPCCYSGLETSAMAIQRRRGRFDWSGRAQARSGRSERSRWSTRRKPRSLRVGHPLGSRDNKSVAEVGERHHPLEANGVSALSVARGSGSPRPNALTRWVCRRVVKVVSQPWERGD
jgi:hypothetical protein